MLRKKPACSFCGRSEAEVAKLVAGPKVFICDECVAIAGRIMGGGDEPDPRPARRGFSRKGRPRSRGAAERDSENRAEAG